jgi:hypothetical protein
MAPESKSRPFGLSDVLVLIAATAFGFALTRSIGDFLGAHRSDAINYRNDGPRGFGHRETSTLAYFEAAPPDSLHESIRRWIQRAAFWPGPSLAALTLAVLAFAALSRHDVRRQAFRGPGVAACVACVVAFCVAAVETPRMLVTSWPNEFQHPPEFFQLHWLDWWLFTWFTLPKRAGESVALIWLVLVLSGRWTAERGWLDRLGRLLGLCWIGMALLMVLSSWLMP